MKQLFTINLHYCSELWRRI